MKKSLFVLPLAALAMVACSSDVVTSNAEKVQLANADQLTIYPAVQGSTTRATPITTATLTEFKVRIEGNFQKGENNAEKWGSGEEQVVTKSGSSWKFDTGTEYWWADKSTPAAFTAWYPSAFTNSITVEDAIADQRDVLVAYNEGAREDFDAGVPLNFQHVMSQIIVKALNKNASSNFKVMVGGIKLCHAKNAGTLTYPTASTEASAFSWDSYDPWSATSGDATYKNGVEYTDPANVSAPKTLTASAQNLADPMLLMPQTLATADLTQTSLTGNYLAILVKVTGAQVGYRDVDGHYYHTSKADENKIPFTAKRNPDDTAYNTYTAEELTALKNGTLPSAWTSSYTNSVSDVQTAIQGLVGKTIVKDTETIYPKQGFGTSCDRYAYVGVDLGGLEWKPGYKYTYTLNFSKDGIGKSIADQPGDKPTTGNFPYGDNFETGEPNEPGQDIVDNPVQLFFTVTVDQWIDADPINKDM